MTSTGGLDHARPITEVGLLLGRLFVKPKTLLSEIDDALMANEFQPFAQPIFSLETGEVVGCEILVRWVRSDGRVVSPYHFINLVEESGRIVRLTNKLMMDALQALRPIFEQDSSFSVAFNISPSHFCGAGFVSEIRRLVDQSFLASGQVVLELTERQELPDLAAAAETIGALKQSGVCVAIDDVGTGHSGLSYLQKLSVNIVKVDKSFVDSIDTDRSARLVVEMLVRLARQLGMKTIAEGIEREEQLTWLRQIGIDEGQGYLVSPPLPMADFIAFARTTRNGRGVHASVGPANAAA